MQAWRVGNERAETYLRLLAEAELRRAGDQLRRLDIAAKDVWADPGMTPFRTLEGATWKVIRTGRILVAAGVLDQDYLDHVAADLHAAIKVRSRLLLTGIEGGACCTAPFRHGSRRGRDRRDGTGDAGPRDGDGSPAA